ncbi:acyl carrier protein [bacterium]|nr:acyl carrier protein [bacterium]
MTNEQIVAAVNEVFKESFEIKQADLLRERHLFDDLGLDSLDVVDLAVGLQQKFDVKVRDDPRLRGIRTLGDVYDYVIELSLESQSDKKPV